ncbi:MAG TPA: hypothetical protein DEB09_04680 [Candidatus Magasanikbacteria bacterium]|nr:hypothetical protein [Candidatus Magasanikbacteria bacterium]
MINNKGQSLLEVIVALAIFALISATMVSLSTGGFVSMDVGGEQTEAQALVGEGMEAIRTIRDRAWNELIFTTSSITTSSGQWIFSGENTTAQLGDYTRTIVIEPVCRDVSNNIDTCPGFYTDIQTKKITSQIDWPVRNTTNTVKQVTYLTNWDSLNWIQTDWSGGNSQSIWSDITKYDSDDNNIDFSQIGIVQLKNTTSSACGIKVWDFNTSTDFNYDLEKIIVTSSLVQLVDQGGGFCSGTATACNTFSGQVSCQTQDGCFWGGGISSSTVNSNFNLWPASWLIGSDSGATYSRQSTGGNPTGYYRGVFPSTRGVIYAYYLRQPFIVNSAISSATISFDHIVSQYTGPADSIKFYVYVDPTSGSYGTPVWTSDNQTGTTTWTSVTNIDVTNKIVGPGTYYLKVRGVVDYQNTGDTQSYTLGLDNVLLNWTMPGNICSGIATTCNTYSIQTDCQGSTGQDGCYWANTATYPSDRPSINPIASHTVDNINTWSSFSEIATKNGGEIYYQLSDDEGSTWQYWDGVDWSVATGIGNYNISSVINTNLSFFSTSTANIMFKAFLESDGLQLVQLDKIEIGCAQAQDSTFDSSIDYSYDDTKIEFVSGTAQLKDQGGDDGFCSGVATACDTYSTSLTCSEQGSCLWVGGISSSTVNSSFNTSLGSWLFGSDSGATYSRQSIGGNPTGYYRGVFPSTRGVIYAYYLRQPFIVNSAISSATISFDHIVSQYTGPADSIKFFVYVDTVPSSYGTPVWVSATQTATTTWISETNINATSKITGPGTYYLKVRGVVDYKNTGPLQSYTLGMDNVLLTWTKNNSCSGIATACNTYSVQTDCQGPTGQAGCVWNSSASYDINLPTVNPVLSQVVSTSSLSSWSSFSEIATKNGGEIYYQLSDDDGSTWQYWDGAGWSTVSGVSDYNIATVVNTNINYFSTSTGSIMFRAFLESNGTQLVQLDNVRVGWGEITGNTGYATFGYLVSSAYNMSPSADGSPVQILSWNEDLNSCSGCDIKMQVRVAPDASGSPGTWGDWYGAGGVDTYYTDPMAVLLPTDLNWKQWVQYRVDLSGDGATSPVLQDVTVNYK